MSKEIVAELQLVVWSSLPPMERLLAPERALSLKTSIVRMMAKPIRAVTAGYLHHTWHVLMGPVPGSGVWQGRSA